MKTIPVEKNDTRVVEIIDLTHEGMGVAKIDGYPLFIENTLPGEEAEILVLKVGKQFGYGKLVKLLKESPDRVALKDADLTRTGIAPLQHLVYPKQLEFKKEQVQKVMTKIAKMPDVPIFDTLGMETPFAYRNKAQIPVRKIQRELATGFFRKNSHDLVPIEDYYIQDPAIDAAVNTIASIMRRFSVKPYEEETNTGNLRHILVKRGHYSHEMMVVLVTRTEKLFPSDKICETIVKEIPEVVSIVQNIQSEKTNVILGKESKVLYGKSAIVDRLLGKNYLISAGSFFQVNSVQAEVLYQTAIDFAEFTGDEIVIDAYCGIGTIALSVADKVKKVYGVEVVKSAINDAKNNANLNNIENAEFVVGKAENVMARWLDEGMKPDVIIVDPPRKGLTPSFIEAAAKMAPKKVVYVSCNPATMARDCQLFAEQGYKVEKVQPVDMFPQTAHVECVAVLTKK